jgi:hypothetical protein
MNITDILVIIGIILVGYGLVLLVIKWGTSDQGPIPRFEMPGGVAFAGPTGLVVILIGIGCIFLPSKFIKTSTSAGSTPTVSPEPVIAPSTAGASQVRITMPTNNAVATGNGGVSIHGTAADFTGMSLWIFVRSSGTYYVDNLSPIVISDGNWRFIDRYVGSNSDTGKFAIDAIVATSSCDESIRSAQQQPGGGIAFRVLPPGCTVGYSVTINRVK